MWGSDSGAIGVKQLANQLQQFKDRPDNEKIGITHDGRLVSAKEERNARFFKTYQTKLKFLLQEADTKSLSAYAVQPDQDAVTIGQVRQYVKAMQPAPEMPKRALKTFERMLSMTKTGNYPARTFISSLHVLTGECKGVFDFPEVLSRYDELAAALFKTKDHVKDSDLKELLARDIEELEDGEFKSRMQRSLENLEVELDSTDEPAPAAMQKLDKLASTKNQGDLLVNNLIAILQAVNRSSGKSGSHPAVVHKVDLVCEKLRNDPELAGNQSLINFAKEELARLPESVMKKRVFSTLDQLASQRTSQAPVPKAVVKKAEVAQPEVQRQSSKTNVSQPQTPEPPSSPAPKRTVKTTEASQQKTQPQTPEPVPKAPPVSQQTLKRSVSESSAATSVRPLEEPEATPLPDNVKGLWSRFVGGISSGVSSLLQVLTVFSRVNHHMQGEIDHPELLKDSEQVFDVIRKDKDLKNDEDYRTEVRNNFQALGGRVFKQGLMDAIPTGQTAPVARNASNTGRPSKTTKPNVSEVSATPEPARAVRPDANQIKPGQTPGFHNFSMRTCFINSTLKHLMASMSAAEFNTLKEQANRLAADHPGPYTHVVQTAYGPKSEERDGRLRSELMMAFVDLMQSTMNAREGAQPQGIRQKQTRFHQACYELGRSKDQLAARFSVMYPHGGPDYAGSQEDANEFMGLLLDVVDEDQQFFDVLSFTFMASAKGKPELTKTRTEAGLPILTVPLDGRGLGELMKPEAEELTGDNRIRFSDGVQHDTTKTDYHGHPKPQNIKRLSFQAKAFDFDQSYRNIKKTKEARSLVLSHPFEVVTVPVLNTTTKRLEDVQLEVSSIVAHIGGDARSGHYVTYEKHNGEWYLYDDQHTVPVGDIQEEFRRNEVMIPYLMNYQRVSDQKAMAG